MLLGSLYCGYSHYIYESTLEPKSGYAKPAVAKPSIDLTGKEDAGDDLPF